MDKTPASELIVSQHKENSALDRVTSLPVVASTWNAMHMYYSNVKKNYPNVTPYLESVETLTCSAANIALATSKPVVDKLAPTINSYANSGLDKLEDKLPIITKEPEEIYQQTKSSATNLLTSRVNKALNTTEDYVDYYLPGDESEEESSEDDQETDDDGSSIDEEIEEKAPRARIRQISNKVRERSYRKAMLKWRDVHVRSTEALERLHFTVDLIQYAQETIKSTPSNLASSANEKVMSGVNATVDGFQNAAVAINKQVEERVLVRARNLTGQLSRSCTRAVDYLQTYPRLHHLLEQARKAKETAEDLAASFADKTSISQLSSVIVESTRPKVKFVEDTLLNVLERLVDQPPVNWLAPDLEVDPLDGMAMGEIEAQLYDRPRQEDDVENRTASPVRRQG